MIFSEDSRVKIPCILHSASGSAWLQLVTLMVNGEQNRPEALVKLYGNWLAGSSNTFWPVEKIMLKKLIVAILVISLFNIAGCSSGGPGHQNVRSYSEGLAPVQFTSGQWGYINSEQQAVIPARFDDAKEFKNGKAAAKLNGKWGFINKRGEWHQ